MFLRIKRVLFTNDIDVDFPLLIVKKKKSLLLTSPYETFNCIHIRDSNLETKLFLDFFLSEISIIFWFKIKTYEILIPFLHFMSAMHVVFYFIKPVLFSVNFIISTFSINLPSKIIPKVEAHLRKEGTFLLAAIE